MKQIIVILDWRDIQEGDLEKKKGRRVEFNFKGEYGRLGGGNQRCSREMESWGFYCKLQVQLWVY